MGNTLAKKLQCSPSSPSPSASTPPSGDEESGGSLNSTNVALPDAQTGSELILTFFSIVKSGQNRLF